MTDPTSQPIAPTAPAVPVQAAGSSRVEVIKLTDAQRQGLTVSREVSIPGAAASAQRQDKTVVTEFNVGARCLSEDDCIAQGINFAAYERGVSDAAQAFGRDPVERAVRADEREKCAKALESESAKASSRNPGFAFAANALAATIRTESLLVPREPTEAMCRAGESCEGSSSDMPFIGGSYTPENVELIYKAMIAATPAAMQPADLDYEALWNEAMRKAMASNGSVKREFALAVLAATAMKPLGWKLAVEEDEERSWLRIVSPGGAELAFSSQRGSNGAQLLQDLSVALIGSKS